MLECYEAYADYEDVAARCEPLVASRRPTRRLRRRVRLLATVARGTASSSAIREQTGIDIDGTTTATRWPPRCATGARRCQRATRWPQLVDDCSPSTSSPRCPADVLLDYPLELSPFASATATTGLVERFEAYVGGIEIANAFTELNDPDEQRAAFEAQSALAGARRRGGAAVDEAFVAGPRARHAADRRARHRDRSAGDGC